MGIKFLRKEKNIDGNDVNIYSYEFSTGDLEIGKVTDELYGGIPMYDEVIHMIGEQFNWTLLKKAFNLDMNKPEDYHKFLKKIYPEHDITLDELKNNWNAMDDLK